MVNIVVVEGNLTKQPELRYTPQGTAVCTLGLANNQKVKGEDKAHFFSVVCWGKTAETVNQYLGKGSRVLVEGRLEQRRWQDNEGKNRSVVEIVAIRVNFINTKPKNEAEMPTVEADDINEDLF